jgi:CubicO group peptidase (beta-lactamase class C family)
MLVMAVARPSSAQDVGRVGDGRLGDVLEGIRAEANLPALAGMLIRGDSILELAAVGLRAVGSPDSVTAGDLWHIGSNTKAMTATLAGVLVERGVVSWGTTFGEVFPELTDSIRPEFVDVRLDELLNHTAGVSNEVGRTPSWPRLRASTASLPEQRRTWIRELLSLEPGAARGSFAYSNSGYIVAGAMLERLTGESWETLMRREVFAPLGMDGAGFGAPGRADAIDQPRGHMSVGSLRPVIPGPLADNPAALGPAGTVHASFSDYAKFVIAHLAGARGSGGLVSAATFARLHQPPSDSIGYALGWGVAEREWAHGRVLVHNGSNTMWFHTVWIAPERNIAVVAATNAAAGEAAQAVDRAVGAMIGRFDARESGEEP